MSLQFERRRGVEYQIYGVEDARLCRGLLVAWEWAKTLKLVSGGMSPSELVKKYAFLANESTTSIGLAAIARTTRRNVISGTDYSWLLLGGWREKGVHLASVTFEKNCLTYSKQVDNKVEVRLGAYPGRVYTGRFYIYSEMVRTGVRLGVDRNGEVYVLDDDGTGEVNVLYKSGEVLNGAEERMAFWGINPGLLENFTFDDFHRLTVRYIGGMMKKDASYNDILEWFREILTKEKRRG